MEKNKKRGRPTYSSKRKTSNVANAKGSNTPSNVPNGGKEKDKKVSGNKNDKGLTPDTTHLIDACKYEFGQQPFVTDYSDAGRAKYVEPSSIQIDWFDPQDLPEDRKLSILVFGKRRTGKSFWTRWYLSQRREDIKEAFVFTKTKDNGFFQEFIPSCFVFDKWDGDKAMELIDRAREMVADDEDPCMHVICDDLAADKTTRTDEALNDFYVLGRHLGITIYFLSQKFKAVPPIVRNNADIVVIFTQFNNNEASQIAEEFLGRLNKTTAMQLIDMYASQKFKTCLVIEAWRNETDPSKYLKVSLAEDPLMQVGDIGSDEYLEAARQMELEEKLHTESERNHKKDSVDAIKSLFSDMKW